MNHSIYSIYVDHFYSRGSEYSETEEEDEEYCSSMDRRYPIHSIFNLIFDLCRNVYSSSDTTAEQRGDWEQRDIGYSSGENSIHDTLMTPSPTLPRYFIRSYQIK